MKFSFFSLVMSLIFFNIYIILISFLKKHDKFIISFRVFPLMFLAILSIVRVIFNFEFKNSIYIESEIIYPKIIDILRTPIYPTSETTISKVLLIIWILGTIFMTIRSIFLYGKFKKDLKEISKVNLKSDIKVIEKIRRELAIKNNIKVTRSSGILTPIVVGILSYDIYLPDIYISDKDLENILLHEVNHIRGKDNLKKLMILFLKIVFWWNPFVYIFNNDIDHILEIQCDLRTTVNMGKESRRRYLGSILNMLETIRERTSLAEINYKDLYVSALYKDNKEKIIQRFNLVTSYSKENKASRIRKIVFYHTMIILLISSYVFTIKPAYYPKEEGIYHKNEEFRTKIKGPFILKPK